jgi:hypothetical protein
MRIPMPSPRGTNYANLFIDALQRLSRCWKHLCCVAAI